MVIDIILYSFTLRKLGEMVKTLRDLSFGPVLRSNSKIYSEQAQGTAFNKSTIDRLSWASVCACISWAACVCWMSSFLVRHWILWEQTGYRSTGWLWDQPVLFWVPICRVNGSMRHASGIHGWVDWGTANMTESRFQAFVLVARMSQTSIKFNGIKYKVLLVLLYLCMTIKLQ